MKGQKLELWSLIPSFWEDASLEFLIERNQASSGEFL